MNTKLKSELKNGDIITFRVKRNKVRKIKTYLFQEDCWKLIKAFMFKPAECCGKHCDETCGLKWVMGFNNDYISGLKYNDYINNKYIDNNYIHNNYFKLCDRIMRQPFCDNHIIDYTTEECSDCSLTFPYSELTYLDISFVNRVYLDICKSCLIKRNKKINKKIYERDCSVKSNCGCKSTSDLRCLCFPKKDYRKKSPYTKDFIFCKYKKDFRKCPMRFTSATEFMLNDYDKYKHIENATTVKDKIKIFKQIIIKDFKLTSKDFEIILNNYLEEEDNIIQPILRDEDVEDSN